MTQSLLLPLSVAKMEESSGVAVSLLSLSRVRRADQGNYTCRPASGGEAVISLHVLEGELYIQLVSFRLIM